MIWPASGHKGTKLAQSAIDPIHQFHLKEIFHLPEIAGFQFVFTNNALFMFAAVALVTLTLVMGANRAALVPGRFQSVAELWYELIETMVNNVMGKEGMKLFPLVFSLFSFVLMANMLGMMPYFPTVTSHVIVTGTLATMVILLVVAIGLRKHGLHFFKLFVPSGVPKLILPVIVLIEVLSFLSRPLSLGLRLFGNMLAGHIVLKVFAGFVTLLIGSGVLGVLGAIAPLGMAVALTALEFLVAFLQAFVFAILTCVYLNDALHPGH
jgi:F-type H+-transporting ATPase subunit a